MDSGIRGVRVAITGVLLCAIAMQAYAATITVTNTNDSGPGSFRQALANANDGDTINFAVTGTIQLINDGLLVAKNVTISGPGSDQLSIDGNQALFVFGVFPDKSATISGLTIRNGQTGIWNEQGTLIVSNCIISGNSEIGLYDHGTLTVSNCVVSGNSYGLDNHAIYGEAGAFSTIDNTIVSNNSGIGVSNIYTYPPGDVKDAQRHDAAGQFVDGSNCAACLTMENSIVSENSEGGVYNYSGSVTIQKSTLSGNSAGQFGDGGGILVDGFKIPAFTTVSDSTISGNSASGAGGGIASYYWSVTIVNSTISGNSAGDVGGGIAGYVTIANSTISGNSAGTKGGGIFDSAHIRNSTFSGNSAGSGGGIYNISGLEIYNTILNAGASGENIFNDGGTVTSQGYNLSSDDGGGYLNGSGDQINTDPLLGPLQDNGGPTLTHMPLPGSPAIDAGDPNFTPPPFRDQRGPCFHRVFRRIDVGSVETQPERPCPTPRPRPTPP
jgi:parallel beta helix pectate lyase-like protein